MIKKISSYIIVLAIGAGLGTYFNQKHTIEEKIVIKDRIKTVIKEVITQRPDGTTVTERTIHKDEDKKTVATKKESIPSTNDWGIGIKYDLFTAVPVYTIEIHRRILFDFYITGYGRTDNVVGVGLLYTF